MGFATNGIPFPMDSKLYETKDQALTRMKEIKKVHEELVMYVRHIKNN
jgi:hypothetical protein